MQAVKSQKDELTISQASKLLSGSRYHNRAPSLSQPGEASIADKEERDEEV